MRKFLIALVVLVVVLVIADRVLVYVAQRKVADRVSTAYSLQDKPSVTIRGFPFLTQVVAGHYDEVDVSLTSVVQDGVQLKDLRARFDGVHAPLNKLVSGGTTPTITADRATATALIPFATVQQRMPAGIKLGADGGNLLLSGKLGYQGLEVPVTAAVTLNVTDSAIEITPRNIRVGTVAGTLSIPPGLLGARLTIALPVHSLPMHLEVTGVRVTQGGFQVSAAGQNVAFQSRA